MKLFPEQATHVCILLKSLRKNRSALDLSCTGAGKSVIAVEIAKILELPTLIVCPLSVVPMWKALCKEQGLKPIDVLNYEKLRSKNNKYCRKVGSQWVWNFPMDSLIIWDEAARLKSYNSIINKIAVAAKPYYNLLLSATIAESPIHLRATGYLLGLHGLRNYWDWARKHGAVVNQWGALTFNGDKKILNEIHKEKNKNHD